MLVNINRTERNINPENTKEIGLKLVVHKEPPEVVKARKALFEQALNTNPYFAYGVVEAFDESLTLANCDLVSGRLSVTGFDANKFDRIMLAQYQNDSGFKDFFYFYRGLLSTLAEIMLDRYLTKGSCVPQEFLLNEWYNEWFSKVGKVEKITSRKQANQIFSVFGILMLSPEILQEGVFQNVVKCAFVVTEGTFVRHMVLDFGMRINSAHKLFNLIRSIVIF